MVSRCKLKRLIGRYMQKAADIESGHRPYPCQLLAMAIVERTIIDAVGGNLSTMNHQREAREAIYSDSQERGSFRYWLEHAVTDANGVLENVRKMLKEGRVPPRVGKGYKNVRC